MLRIADITFRIAGRLLFDGASVTVPAGHRVGLVGPNGAGKTTLLKLISGELEVDGGAVAVRRGARLGLVAQEAPGGPENLLETVLAADSERAALLARAETETDPERIAELHNRLADIGAHTAPARAAAILAGLGFDEAAQARACADYSGGWRMRVALAAALFSEPDLLLLDEPTNHLDLEAVLWLEGYLRSYPKTLVIVSHDRDLLNNAVGHILSVEDGKLTLYAGGYDRFERTRRERQAHQEKLRQKQDAQRKHIEAFVERFRYKASKARQAQSRIKMLERMQPVAAMAAERTPSFRFPQPAGLAPPLITFDEAAVGYRPGEPVLDRLSLRIDPDDRIALLGANGNGKSTFAKLLAKRLAPMSGQMVAAPKLEVGFFAQHQLDELTPGQSAFEHMAELMPGAKVAEVRARLGPFGLAQGKADVAVEQLSGGEKARLLLALMSRKAPQILVLDEPTNHLDVDAREALIHAINEFSGAVVLISHDPHLIGLVADRLWLVADGRVKPFDGDLGDYRRLVTEERRAGRRTDKDAGGAGGSDKQRSRKEMRRAAADARAAVAALRKQAKQAEAEIARLNRERDAIEAKLAAPETYDASSETVTDLNKRHGEIAARLAAAEARWMAAAEALEAAE